MNYNSTPFMFVKPEAVPYLDQISPSLMKHQLQIGSAYYVPDWVFVARHVYEKRLAKSSEEFRVGFEGHLWLSSYLFGKRGLILTIQAEEGADQDVLAVSKKLADAKQTYRNALPHTRNGSIIIAMDISKVEQLQGTHGAISGVLGVTSQTGVFFQFEKAELGKWDNYYLKYIHTPDPNFDDLIFEWNVLLEIDAITNDQKYSDEQWFSLQKLNSIIPKTYL